MFVIIIIQAIVLSMVNYIIGQQLWFFHQIAIQVLALAKFNQNIKEFALWVGTFLAIPNGILY